MGHVNQDQVEHLSKTPLNLLEIHEIGSVDTSKSKQQNYDQLWHLLPPYEKLLGLSHVSWLSHSPVVNCILSLLVHIELYWQGHLLIIYAVIVQLEICQLGPFPSLTSLDIFYN